MKTNGGCLFWQLLGGFRILKGKLGEVWPFGIGI